MGCGNNRETTEGPEGPLRDWMNGRTQRDWKTHRD